MERVIFFSMLVLCSSSYRLEKMGTIFNGGCEIDPNDNLDPLVIYSGSSDYIYPDLGKTTLTFNSGDTLDFACPGRTIEVESTSYDVIVTATCISGTTFEVNGYQIDWNDIQCSTTPWRTARFTGESCENGGRLIEIGFEIPERFLRSILICFDDKKQQLWYSHSNITKSINLRKDDTPRPTWMQGTNLFSIKSINKYYLRSNQRKTVNMLVGLNATSTKYIQNNNYFLSRGHTTARGDNFYPAQMNASFFLVNVAPQWQSFNGDNWNQVELSIRDYAEANAVDLQQWTGVYGVTTLPHEETGESVELYLYTENGEKKLPVPEFYWKVAYEPQSQQGVAVIGINNPYLSSYEPICEDVSDQLEWKQWEKSDQEQGFVYACTIDSFRQVVNYLPKFPVSDLLK